MEVNAGRVGEGIGGIELDARCRCQDGRLVAPDQVDVCVLIAAGVGASQGQIVVIIYPETPLANHIQRVRGRCHPQGPRQQHSVRNQRAGAANAQRAQDVTIIRTGNRKCPPDQCAARTNLEPAMYCQVVVDRGVVHDVQVGSLQIAGLECGGFQVIDLVD